MLTIDDKLQHILGIKTLASVIRGSIGSVHRGPEMGKSAQSPSNIRSNGVGQKGAT